MARLFTDPSGRRWVVDLGGVISNRTAQEASVPLRLEHPVLVFDAIDGQERRVIRGGIPAGWQGLPEPELAAYVGRAEPALRPTWPYFSTDMTGRSMEDAEAR